jgi:hypothetical protein
MNRLQGNVQKKGVSMTKSLIKTFCGLKTTIEQKNEQFLLTVSKLTAMTELIRRYEPAGHDGTWEALQGVAQIIEEITDECHDFRANTMETFESLDNCLCEVFEMTDMEA